MGRSEKPKFTPCMPSLLPKLDEEEIEDNVSRVSLSSSNSSSSLPSIYEDFLLPTAHPPVPIPTSPAPSLSSSSSFVQPSFPISFSTPSSSSMQTSTSLPRPRSHHTRSHSTNSSIIVPPSVLMSPAKNPVNNNNNGNLLRASMEDGGGGAFTRNNNNSNSNSNNNNNNNNNGNNKSASAGDLLEEHGPFSKHLFLKILFPWNDRPGSVYKVRKFGPDTTVDQALSELNSNLSDGYKSSKNKLYFNGLPLEGPKELASFGFQHSDILHFKREPEYEFSAPNAKQGGHLTLDPNIVIHDVIKKILVWMFGSIPASSQDSRSSSPRYKLLKKIQAASPVMGATWGIRLMEAKKLTDYGIRKRDVLQLVVKTGSSKLNENNNNDNDNNNDDPPKHETIYEIDVEDAPVTADIEDDKDVKDIKEEEEVVNGKPKRRSLKRGILRRASEQNLTANNNAVGTPFNVVHKSHVNFDYQWTGDNVAESFEYKEKLGQGGYGAVFKAVHKETGFTLAIKTLSLNGAGRSDLQKEIDILKKCRCSNVLSYYGSAVVKNEIWILMDLCSVGSAKDLMKTCVETLDETQISMIAREVLKGLAYLHARNIIHMDVKAANILLTEDGCVKLADFGVSQQLQETSSQSDVLIGSPLWMAPEILLKNPYDHKADSWSLGITLIELAEGRAPAPRGVRKLEDLIKLTPTMPPPAFTNTRQWSPMFVDFVSKCLVKDPASRMNAVELLAHPFIGGAGGPEVIMDLIKDCLRIKAAKQEKERLRAASSSPSVL